MRVLLLSFLLSSFTMVSTTRAHDIPLKYSKSMKGDEKKILEVAFEEVADLLPEKMKQGLPDDLQINVAQLSTHKVIPDEVCGAIPEATKEENKEENKQENKDEKNKRFIYGQYDHYKKTLTINAAVLSELQKGKERSKRINCQHKSLYDQAIATIVHELTHAFDFNQGRLSSKSEFISKSGFKKGLVSVKTKNVKAMRSADVYELVNVAEAFAVNMEYFTMDPEFMCRKPSMFEYYKRLFEVDPFPNRKCKPNNVVMVSSPTGFIPAALNASRVYRIDYLVASAGKGITSGFGHSMFRIVICAPERFDAITNTIIPATPFGKKCLEDKLFHLVVSYRANVEDATLNYMKGLTGGYPSMLFILNFSDVLDEYNRDELRDVVAYPMNFSAKEKDDFVTRVKEEHWSYRGSYKFINNNCAVESYDLLKAALERNELNSLSSVSPNGVLEDLDKLNILSVKDKDIETFKAKTDQVVLAYNKAYGYKLKKSDKSNKTAVQKFIDDSSIEERMERFQKFTKSQIPTSELNTEITLLKERMVIASSFSVMEQQILRTLALKYRKEAAEMFSDLKDERLKQLLKESGMAFAQPFSNLSKDGYGIPFPEELQSQEERAAKAVNGAEIMAKAEKVLRELMPNEFSALETIGANIKVYNQYSLQVRKEFRTKLETYIPQVLRNLTRDEFTRSILVSAGMGNAESLAKVRDLLGKDLVNEKEVLDVKLQRLIKDML